MVSAMGQAVGDALMSSRRFIRESLAKSWEADTTGIGRDAQRICDRAAPDIVLEDEVTVKLAKLESLEQGEQRQAFIRE